MWQSQSRVNTLLLLAAFCLTFLGTTRFLPLPVTTLGLNKLILPLLFLLLLIKNRFSLFTRPSLKVLLLAGWLAITLAGTVLAGPNDKSWSAIQLFWLQLLVFAIGYVTLRPNYRSLEKWLVILSILAGGHSLLTAVKPSLAQTLWERFFFETEITRYIYDLARGRIVAFIGPYIFLPFVLNYWRRNAKLAALALALILFSAVSSGYRQVFLSLVVTAGGYWLLNRRRFHWRWQLLLLAGGLVMGLGISLATGYGQLFSRLTPDDGGNFVSRFVLYEQAVESWQASPLLGIGKGNLNANVFPGYEYVFGERDRLVLVWNTWIDFVHNYFLEILADTGLSGLILFAIFNVAINWESLKLLRQHLSKEERAFLIAGLAVLWGYYADNLFTVSYISDLLIVWLLLGLIASLIDQSETRAAPQGHPLSGPGHKVT